MQSNNSNQTNTNTNIDNDNNINPSPKLKPRSTLKGHKAEVVNVQFSPSNKDILCSVGFDKQSILWDLRMKKNPALIVQGAHQSEITHLSWSIVNENQILTGAKDGLIKFIDLRKGYNVMFFFFFKYTHTHTTHVKTKERQHKCKFR